MLASIVKTKTGLLAMSPECVNERAQLGIRTKAAQALGSPANRQKLSTKARLRRAVVALGLGFRSVLSSSWRS